MDASTHPDAAPSIQRFAASEAGAWSNSYLIGGRSEAILFDVVQLHSEAVRLAEMIAASGKTLTTVMISHAHPDHFMGLDVITERFPRARVVSAANVVADIRADGPWMCALLQDKLGREGPARLVTPDALAGPALDLEGTRLDVVEFGEGESKHTASVYIPGVRALLAADLVYNRAHAYLQERHLDSWLSRLAELEAFADGRVSTIYPGHGAAADAALIPQTRAYLRDFAEAVRIGDARLAEERMLAAYPEYRVRQFLSVFSIPAYFPGARSAS
jgi:glyoxylase-like metal-dependent hydrolase (beta-lactamase superfamily II)